MTIDERKQTATGVIQNLILENRGKLSISGVIDVLSFDDQVVMVETELGLLTVNALTASNSIIIPIQCEFFALEGLSQLMNTVRLVKHHLNSELDIEGVILTMKDKRSNLVAEVSQEIMKFFGKKVYETFIPRNIRLAEAPSHGKPIMLYDVASKGAEAYLQLAEDFLERNKDSYKKITKHSKFKLRGSN